MLTIDTTWDQLALIHHTNVANMISANKALAKKYPDKVPSGNLVGIPDGDEQFSLEKIPSKALVDSEYSDSDQEDQTWKRPKVKKKWSQSKLTNLAKLSSGDDKSSSEEESSSDESSEEESSSEESSEEEIAAPAPRRTAKKPPTKKRRRACGKCSACTRPKCGKCKACQNPARKQKCFAKKCHQMGYI